MKVRVMSRKKLNGLTYRVSKQVVGKVLAQAYVMIRREGLIFHIARFDNEVRSCCSKKEHRRINVRVVDGMVRSAWVG
jgi:hypothetical protein